MLGTLDVNDWFSSAHENVYDYKLLFSAWIHVAMNETWRNMEEISPFHIDSASAFHN